MTKITLDRETFKALASDTRLDILKTLDGRNMGLNEIARVTNLNKATLHEHLSKLNEAGLIKRNERDGHKWVYYRLTWKGESLLHPENTKIVVLFTTTFVALWVGILEMIWYIKGTVVNLGYNIYTVGKDTFLERGLLGASGQSTATPPLDAPGFLRDIFFHGRTPVYVPSGGEIPLGGTINVIDNGSHEMLSAGDSGQFVVQKSQELLQAVYQNPVQLYLAVACFAVFTAVLCVALWRLWVNRTPRF